MNEELSADEVREKIAVLEQELTAWKESLRSIEERQRGQTN